MIAAPDVDRDRRGLVPGGCADFVNDTTSTFKVLVGGLGSGKTDASVCNTLIVGSVNAPLPYLYVEPTIDLIRTAALPTFRRVLDRLEVNHVWHDRDKTLVVGEGVTRFPIWFRSGEDPERITAYEVAAANIDEAARQKRGVWKAVNERCRAPGTKRKQVSMTSSPEGHNWFYDVAQAKPPPGLKLYRARTADNPHLSPSYLRDMRATMTDAEFDAYAEGKFVNLTTGLVYQSFSRATHCKPCANPFEGQLVVGCDFNVGRMCFVIGRRLFDEIHWFAEVTGVNTNTYRQAEVLLETVVRLRRRAPSGPFDPRRWVSGIRVHTDASGGSRKTSATESDIQILTRFGFTVTPSTSNPPIKDRVYSVEKMLRGRGGRPRMFVDARGCPELVRALEGQGWSGSPPLPEKGKGLDDLSGPVDAIGYGLWGFPDFRSTMPEGNRTVYEGYT